jgi:RHS repeat-associated protein
MDIQIDNESLSSSPLSVCGSRNLTGASSILPVDSNEGTTYFLADHLGSTQIELSNGGWPIWQGQYTPFGQEIMGADSNQPNGVFAPYTDGTSMHYKFTGKERDAESGLDYFGTRYYGSSMGRFMSPDDGADAVMGVPVPFADLSNPQSLNLYSYVDNNPLTRRDYDGHASYQDDGNGQLTWQGDYSGEIDCNTSFGCLQWNSKSGEWGAVPPKWMNPAADGIKPDYSILEWIVGGKLRRLALV